MKKVITYGTYDFLHYGHINLLKRARELGDYLIVGVTADDFDKQRGKLNVNQSLEERISAIKELGIADKIIVEEYEGQKIDDIRRYGIDIFTVGSDWVGYFDYLKEYCDVIYLPRTKGISSSEIRVEKTLHKVGIIGYSSYLNKVYDESQFVNTVNIVGLCTQDILKLKELEEKLEFVTSNYDELLKHVDAIYIHSHPQKRYWEAMKALKLGKHVLCESPISMSKKQASELLSIAQSNNCIIMESIRTAYLTAYTRLLALVKSGKIGRIVSVDVTCTSLQTYGNFSTESLKWGALEAWGPTALLPVFQILGVEYDKIDFFSIKDKDDAKYDSFTKINFVYKDATANIKVGTGVKSEGDLIISGTEGYIYVPAPWWKTDYFEIRYEYPENNKRYFYQFEGHGIRYELIEFVNAIQNNNPHFYIEKPITYEIANIIGSFYNN